MLRELFGWCFSLVESTLSRCRSASSTVTPSTHGSGVNVVDGMPEDLNETHYITLFLNDEHEWEMSTNCETDVIAAGISETLFRMAAYGMEWTGES